MSYIAHIIEVARFEMPSIDAKDFHWFMGVKFLLTVFIFRQLSLPIAIPVFLVSMTVYRYVLAKLLGLTVMGVGDFNTFVTNEKAPTNIMTCTPVSNANPAYAREVFMRMVKAHVKARSYIVKVLGEFYYKELDMNECIKSQIIDLPDGHIKTQE